MSNILFNKRVSGTWGTTGRINTTETGYDFYDFAVHPSTGVMYVVYVKDGDLYSAEYEGFDTLLNEELIQSSWPGFSVSFAIDQDGDMHLVSAVSGSKVQYFRRTASWSSAEDIFASRTDLNTASPIHMVVNEDKDVCMVWYEQSGAVFLTTRVILGRRTEILNTLDDVLDKDLFIPPSSPSTGDRYIVDRLELDIIDVDQGTKRFTVSGDYVADLTPGDSIVITTGANVGTYTIDTVSLFGTDTDIIVLEAIPSPSTIGLLTYSGGAWSTKKNQIAEWGGASWSFTVPSDRDCVLVVDEGVDYVFLNSEWDLRLKSFSVTSVTQTAGSPNVRVALPNLAFFADTNFDLSIIWYRRFPAADNILINNGNPQLSGATLTVDSTAGSVALSSFVMVGPDGDRRFVYHVGSGNPTYRQRSGGSFSSEEAVSDISSALLNPPGGDAVVDSNNYVHVVSIQEGGGASFRGVVVYSQRTTSFPANREVVYTPTGDDQNNVPLKVRIGITGDVYVMWKSEDSPPPVPPPSTNLLNPIFFAGND